MDDAALASLHVKLLQLSSKFASGSQPEEAEAAADVVLQACGIADAQLEHGKAA
jgi:hypothetical protein